VTITTVHFLRHGEVDNPDHVMYGRLPGYHLSAVGRRMAERAAKALLDGDVTYLASSPLERAQETAAPLATALGLPVHVDERLLEAENSFQGKPFGPGDRAWAHPSAWPLLRNPFRPSWGEPYARIAARMLAAAWSARDAAEGHEAVCVSHQLPIWTLRRLVEDKPLSHIPNYRQCGLASLTSITFTGDAALRVTYSEPAGPESPGTTPGA
jgi:broad specificity phosphatase PhoE